MRQAAPEEDSLTAEVRERLRVLAEEDDTVVRQIKGWLQSCMQARRFCPQDPGPFSCDGNICCYVTGDGDEAGAPKNDKDTMLRVAKAKIRDDVFAAVAERIRVHYGTQLHDTCHMGPEECIYRNALDDLMFRFDFDFRRLLGANLFSAKLLLAKLGLAGDLPGIEDHPRERAPPTFIRQFSFTKDEEVVSQGVGVHAFALLLCVSMMLAPTLHPKVSSDFARTVLGEILRFAPAAATPGNSLQVRSFDLLTSDPERIGVSGRERPEHFLRPTDDLQFATSGKFTVGRVIGAHPPEDLLHAGFLPLLADMLHCSILDVPGNMVLSSYEIMPDRPYAVWIPRAKKDFFGSLVAKTSERKVKVSIFDTPEGDCVTEHMWGHDEWEHELRQMNAILPPMIWRSGACVVIETTSVGVVIPYESGSNYDPETAQYRVMCGQPDNKIHLMFWEVLQKLIPVGEMLALDLSVAPHNQLLEQTPAAWRQHRRLQVRLNVPTVANPEPGKVYVTYLLKHSVARSDASDLAATTIAVDPWSLSTLGDKLAAAYVFARNHA